MSPILASKSVVIQELSYIVKLMFAATQESGVFQVVLNSKRPSSPGSKLKPHTVTALALVDEPTTLSPSLTPRTLPSKPAGIDMFNAYARRAAALLAAASSVPYMLPPNPPDGVQLPSIEPRALWFHRVILAVARLTLYLKMLPLSPYMLVPAGTLIMEYRRSPLKTSNAVQLVFAVAPKPLETLTHKYAKVP